MRNFISVAVMLLVFATSVAAQTCDQFIVLDKYSSDTDYRVYEKVKDAACSNEVQDRASATNAGVKAGIPIPVLDDVFSLTLQGSYQSDDWSHWQKLFCSSHFDEIHTQLRQSNLSQIFSNNAAEIVKTCLAQEPVYAYFEVPKSGDSFAFKFRVAGKDKMARASIDPAEAVSGCNPSNPFGLSPIYQYVLDSDVSGQLNSFSCGWKSQQTVRVHLKLDNQGSRDYQLEKVVHRETPKPAPAPLVTEVGHYASDPDMPSGDCGNYGKAVTVCTPDKPAGWRIVSANFWLTGNRACNAHSHCTQTVPASTVSVEQTKPPKVCWQFDTQGHSEECGHSGNTGIQYSTGHLDATWEHH